MPGKFVLYCHSALIMIDIIFIIKVISAPQKDVVHGGLGHGLMALFGMGAVLLLIAYKIVFLILYFKGKTHTVRVLCWFTIVMSAFLFLSLGLI